MTRSRMVGDVRAKSRWVIWLHRIGYLTTAIVFVELGAIGFVVGREWLRHRQMNAMLVEESRTHEAPIREDGDCQEFRVRPGG